MEKTKINAVYFSARGEIRIIVLKNNPEDPDTLVKLKCLWGPVQVDGKGKFGEILWGVVATTAYGLGEQPIFNIRTS